MHIQSFEQFKEYTPSVQEVEFNRLLAELDRFRNQKYGLVFNENVHQEDVVLQCREELPVLVAPPKDNDLPPVIHHTATKKDFFDHDPERPQPTHLLIEGDNYHALSALAYTHKGAVDLIYIDPPYNTGNRDFRYNDNFVDKEDSARHTKWLSFMKRRLLLARELLKNTGVIFISIDDNEQAQLKLLCDDVFGEGNFIANVIWQSRKSVSNDTFVSLSHNYTLFYANKKQSLDKNNFRLSVNHEKFSNPDNDPRGAWVADPFDAPNIRPNLTYPIQNSKTNEVFLPPKGRCWRTTPEEYQKFLIDNRIVFGKNGNSKPQLKRFLSDAEERGTVPTSIWNDIETTTNGTQQLQKLFENEIVFSNPKPIGLINRILKLSTDKESVVLDFFAGSGTTGHAVLALNREDGGRRQFIMVTNNEVTDKTRAQLKKEGKTEAEIEAQGIARSVTYPRLRKVIEGYTNAKGEKVEGTGGTMRYFRVGFVPRTDHDHQQRANLKGHCTEMLCLKENVFEKRHDSDSEDYNGRGWEIYQDQPNKSKIMVVLHDADDDTQVSILLDILRGYQGESKVFYVFSFSKNIVDADFEEFIKLGYVPQAMPTEIVELYEKQFRDIQIA